ncbi:HAMP domain-containing sensor histidine kinase [Crocosphaera sp. XPORK-15E]|uniref:sensor histidine kinase n=1 Tax=Crocosphaera sp. XPORK-15E TaxID=3110247 RepID=UPI002B220F92|nr:HAMP domain-containing sensor histidine kinase [Crocosphaera sp. XPORK-15E]MEA5536322.1 HAMP domain-containing sensor histidine kinase [Crocosphaera sp. XPORK-15E]
MIVSEGLLEKLSDIINRHEDTVIQTCVSQQTTEEIDQLRLKGQGQWFSAIAALETLLLSQIGETTEVKFTSQGLILSAPTPILCHPTLTNQLQTGIFTLQMGQNCVGKRFQLPAAPATCVNIDPPGITQLPLSPQDPLVTEQFCLILTPHFGLMMVLGEDRLGLPAFQFSFDPDVVQQGWLTLRSRLVMTHHPQLWQLDEWVEEFPPIAPNYRIVSQFSRLLLHYLPQFPTLSARKIRSFCDLETSKKTAKKVADIPLHLQGIDEATDITLLQALTHEIRTPLTSIRTMTRLLLRSRELEPKMIKLLENIDQECTEQINRMELIFRATELKSKTNHNLAVELVSTSLESLLNQCVPRWKKQAQRRNVVLDVGLPKKLPQVVSDPGMLDQVLTGLIEKCTRSLTNGGHLRVQVSTAGHQLKLQFQTESNQPNNPLQALGQLLMFQPETGSLSLNLDVTKNLFHRLGGKLIVRQRSQQGEVFTIFLPLGTNSVSYRAVK